jgi:hypothetical protein
MVQQQLPLLEGGMDAKRARCTLKRYLLDRIRVTLHEDVPSGVVLYNFDAESELLFSVNPLPFNRIGGSEYLSVSTTTGQVKSYGFRG